MRKQSITTNLTILIFAAACLFAPARAGVQSDKESEIRRMLRLTGMQKLMDQMKSQMLTGLRNQMQDVPEEFWTRFEKKLDVNELIEKLIPIYDKYYSLEDLRAVNAFYASEVGQRLVATLPKITQESMAVGMEWGKRIGEQAEREAREELKKKDEQK